jgi:hypothetical protein
MGEQPHPLASDVVGWRGWNGDHTVFRIEIDPLIILRVTNANRGQKFLSNSVTGTWRAIRRQSNLIALLAHFFGQTLPLWNPGDEKYPSRRAMQCRVLH